MSRIHSHYQSKSIRLDLLRHLLQDPRKFLHLFVLGKAQSHTVQKCHGWNKVSYFPWYDSMESCFEWIKLQMLWLCWLSHYRVSHLMKWPKFMVCLSLNRCWTVCLFHQMSVSHLTNLYHRLERQSTSNHMSISMHCFKPQIHWR